MHRLGECKARCLSLVDADDHFGRRIANQSLNLLGRRSRSLRKGSHLGRDHREAAALLARARRFHRSVQGQDVGLKRNAIDDARDVPDLLRRGMNPLHPARHIPDRLFAALRRDARLSRQLIRLLQSCSAFLHRCRYLGHGGRRLLKCRCLLLGADR